MKHITGKTRLSIVREVRRSVRKFEVLSEYGITKRTYQNWERRLKDFAEESYLALENKSRKPKISPGTFNNLEVIRRIIELKSIFNYGKIRIHHVLLSEGIKCGVSAIEGVLKRTGLWNSKKKKVRKKHLGKHVDKFKIVGEKVQIDLKYAYFGDIRYFQLTAIDLATRLVFTWLYNEKTPENAKDFLEKVIRFFPFKIQSMQIPQALQESLTTELSSHIEYTILTALIH